MKTISNLVLAGCLLTAGCTAPSGDGVAFDPGHATVNVPQTPIIKNQALENCWIYATGTWAESLHKIATGQDFNTSLSYWTYLDWFWKLTSGESTGNTIDEFGSFDAAAQLIQYYGIIAEPDFIPSDVPAGSTVSAETSQAQVAAEEAINASLKSGPLSHAADPATVRAELDKAFGLSDSVKAMMTKAFGPNLDRDFHHGTADATGTPIIPPTQFAVAYPSAPQTPPQTKTLLDATNDWRTVSYSAADHRNFEKRFQRALQDNQPVIMSWFIDFAYADNMGRVFYDPQHPPTPTEGGGHYVVMQDYQIDNVPGYGTLKAGDLVTDPAVFQAALDDAATIEFVRIKNSWGTRSTDVPLKPGYYDLYMNYLEGTIPECEDGTKDFTKCPKGIPFTDITLPPGY
jgi:hypothetical protein